MFFTWGATALTKNTRSAVVVVAFYNRIKDRKAYDVNEC